MLYQNYLMMLSWDAYDPVYLCYKFYNEFDNIKPLVNVRYIKWGDNYENRSIINSTSICGSFFFVHKIDDALSRNQVDVVVKQVNIEENYLLKQTFCTIFLFAVFIYLLLV